MLKKILSFGAFEGIARGCNWLTLALLPLFVPVEVYGLIGLIIAMEELGKNSLIFGQDKAVLRFYYAEQEKKNLLFNILVNTIVRPVPPVAITLLLLYALFSSILGIPVFPHIILLSVFLIAFNVMRIYLAVVRVEENISQYGIVRVGFALSKVILVLTIAHIYQNSIAYIIGAFLAVLLALIIVYPQMSKRLQYSYDRMTARRMFLFGWPLVFHLFGLNIILFADRFILGHLMNAESVGIYIFGYTLGSSILFVAFALEIYFEPIVYRHAQSYEESERWLARFSNTTIASAAAIGIVVLAASPFIIDRFFPGEYIESLRVIPIIIASYVGYPIFLQSSIRVAIYKKTIILAYTTFSAAVVNILLNFILIPYLGLIGAAVASFVTYLLLSYVLLMLSFRSGGIKLREIVNNKIILSAGILMIVLVSINSYYVSLGILLFVLLVSAYSLKKYTRDA